MIGVVVNRNAGGVVRDEGLVERVKRMLGGRGRVLETGRLEEVAGAVADLTANGAELLAICGGDGSIGCAAAALLDRRSPPSPPPRSGWPPSPIPLAILPGGTMNTIGGNLRMRGPPEKLLARLLEERSRPGGLRSRLQPTIEVEGRIGFLFGAGLVGNFFDVYRSSPRRSRTYATVLVARVVVGALLGTGFSRRIMRPVQAEVDVDGRRLGWRAQTFIAAGTLPNVGVGLRILHRAGERTDAFHLVASGLPAATLARQAHRYLTGRPLEGARSHDGLARRATIRFAHPSSFVLDGELSVASEIVVEVGPPVRLVVV